MPKVSELPSATTPLDGDEYLIVVQNGATKKVPASEVGSPGGGATPGGNSDEIQVNSGGSLGGATNVKAGSNYISIGAAPATTGTIRLANNTYIYALDTDGVTDRRIIGLTNGDAVVVGGIGLDLYLGGNGTGQSINGAADTYNFRSGDSGSLFATLTSTGLALRDSTGGQFYTFIPSNLAADRTITLPLLASDDTLVCEAHTQTLSNKTLTAVPSMTMTASGFVSFGGAAAGTIRWPYSAATGPSLRGRNSVSNDPYLLHWQSDTLYVGTDAGFSSQISALTMFAAGTVGIGIGGGTKVFIDSSGIGAYQGVNLGLYGNGVAFPSVGGGAGVFAMANAQTNPSTNPTGGCVLYADSGAAKCRGSGGTVTTFGPADPHCPTCGRDFATEHRNDDLGEHFAVCLPCLIDAVAALGADASKFAFINKRAASKAQWDSHHAAARARDDRGRP